MRSTVRHFENDKGIGILEYKSDGNIFMHIFSKNGEEIIISISSLKKRLS